MRYATDFLRNSEQHAKFFMFPEVFFDWVFTKQGAKKWFSKQILYEIIKGKVRRPHSTFVSFRPRKELVRKPTRNDYAVNALADKIKREGSVFLKPTGMMASEGWGIARIQKNGNTLVITVSEDTAFKSLAETLPLGSFRVAGDKKIEILLSRERSIQRVLGEISSARFAYRHIAEREIRMPLYEGRKWEIRTIVQSPERKPTVVGHFAKVGGDNIAANVALGGREEEASRVISGIYKTLYPHKTKAGIGVLASEFFRRANAEAEKAMGAINSHIQRMAEKYITGLPKSEFYAREAAVDITGELNPQTGKIEPVVGEVQYPIFGGAETGLKKFDPVGYRRYKENRKGMVAQGKEVLMHAFGL
ncbi:MAG: hypothetical protein J4224_02150 [Candidatus Diapherotrites archaeon]|uniref:Uncharacterized protein n=1 Tax=Candidatus Iainarchaeum sp. TaxID=3101447 RepID=A0A7J4IU48_9ARCH|nr:MAG: hypothetical protein QT03_C0001G0021 [archaeon GW2011_AR10]MBS3059206.1 hypothetical protein [Candidatus Diapherotrites archaeon]HIH09023.1 hypothetical protein [Candidatus Diapherotrites archaeon]